MDEELQETLEQLQASIQVVEDKLNALLWHFRITAGLEGELELEDGN